MHPQANPDYNAVRAAIADAMDNDNYDDGSYGMQCLVQLRICLQNSC